MTSIAGTPGRRRAVVEGTFTRSLMAAAARGLALVGAAVLVGVLLLEATDDGGPSPVVVADGESGTTTTTTTTPDGVEPGEGLRPATELSVLVLNAARIEGAAGRTTERLQSHGYQTLAPGNAPQQPDTVVYYKPGFEPEADVLAPLVSDAAFTDALQDPSPFAGTEDADLVVVLGTDFEPPTDGDDVPPPDDEAPPADQAS